MDHASLPDPGMWRGEGGGSTHNEVDWSLAYESFILLSVSKEIAGGGGGGGGWYKTKKQEGGGKRGGGGELLLTDIGGRGKGLSQQVGGNQG